MPRKEKFREYEYETKTTTIRIPDLKDLDKEKQLRKAIDDFVLERLFKKQNLKANTNETDTEIIKKFIPAFLESDYDFPFSNNEQIRLKEIYEMVKNG